jgi:ABC-2 type transport system ATP-binding protein
MGNVLETKDLRKEFGTLIAVNDLNLHLEKGHVLGLIGPNGAGKTTLLRMLATLLPHTSGNADILGNDIRKDYLKARKKIGFLPDFFNLYSDLTLEECLEFFADAYGIPKQDIPARVDEALQFVELDNKRKDFIKHLSRGMTQRMGIACMLVHDPDIFLLDEPASGLDPKARIQLREVLKKLSSQGKSIIISSHILTELSGFCSHIAIMNQGKLVIHGSVEDIQTKISASKNMKITVIDNIDQAYDIIKSFDNSNITSVDKNIISVELTATDEQLAQLNGLLVNSGIKVSGFSEEKLGLEDLFMKISDSQ